MKKRETIFVSALILLGLFFAYDSYRMGFNPMPSEKQERICGSVVHKSEQLEQVKHATRHNMYVTIHCDNGTYHDVDVSTHTYLTVKKGDTICYTENRLNWSVAYCLLCLLCFGAFCVAVIILLIAGIATFYDSYIKGK